MEEKSKLTKIIDSTDSEPSVSGNGSLQSENKNEHNNGLPIKREPGFKYLVTTETVLYSNGYYLRKTVKQIDKRTGELKCTIYFHIPLPPNN